MGTLNRTYMICTMISICHAKVPSSSWVSSSYLRLYELARIAKIEGTSAGYLSHALPKQYTDYLFSPTAESFGVSAQIGSGVIRGGPEARFHEGSTRVPPGFHEGSTRVLRGLRGGASTKKRCCWGYRPSLFLPVAH